MSTELNSVVTVLDILQLCVACFTLLQSIVVPSPVVWCMPRRLDLNQVGLLLADSGQVRFLVKVSRSSATSCCPRSSLLLVSSRQCSRL